MKEGWPGRLATTVELDGHRDREDNCAIPEDEEGIPDDQGVHTSTSRAHGHVAELLAGAGKLAILLPWPCAEQLYDSILFVDQIE